MFYLKPNNYTRIEITDQNIFTTRPECGKEFHVDLMELLLDPDGFDLYGTQVHCFACSKRLTRTKQTGERKQ